MGRRWITAGDCGAIVGMPRYRSGSPTDTANHFAWLAPLGSASKKHLKTRIPEPFYTEWTREGCLGNNPHTAEAWPPNGFPKRTGGRGGDGRIRPKLQFWQLFAIVHLFKSSRIQDGNAPRKYFRPAASRSHIATIIIHHTACKWTVATG